MRVRRNTLNIAALDKAIPMIAPTGITRNNPEAATALSDGSMEAWSATNTALMDIPVPKPL